MPLARTNGQAGGLRFLFVLFLFVQEKDTFSFGKGRKYVLFSMGRKGTKRATETPSRTLIHLLGSINTRLPTDGTAHLRALSVIRRAVIECGWNPCAAGAKSVAHALSPVRRVPPWLVRTCEHKHVLGADGICFRYAQTIKRDVRGFFSSFSFRKEKDAIS